MTRVGRGPPRPVHVQQLPGAPAANGAATGRWGRLPELHKNVAGSLHLQRDSLHPVQGGHAILHHKG